MCWWETQFLCQMTKWGKCLVHIQILKVLDATAIPDLKGRIYHRRWKRMLRKNWWLILLAFGGPRSFMEKVPAGGGRRQRGGAHSWNPWPLQPAHMHQPPAPSTYLYPGSRLAFGGPRSLMEKVSAGGGRRQRGGTHSRNPSPPVLARPQPPPILAGPQPPPVQAGLQPPPVLAGSRSPPVPRRRVPATRVSASGVSAGTPPIPVPCRRVPADITPVPASGCRCGLLQFLFRAGGSRQTPLVFRRRGSRQALLQFLFRSTWSLVLCHWAATVPSSLGWGSDCHTSSTRLRSTLVDLIPVTSASLSSDVRVRWPSFTIPLPPWTCSLP